MMSRRQGRDKLAGGWVFDMVPRRAAAVDVPQKQEMPMHALLTTVILWLSANFGLPASHDHPLLEFVPERKSSYATRGLPLGSCRWGPYRPACLASG